MKTQTTDRWRYRRTPNARYRHEEDVGWYALAAGIVKQAVDDYKFADEYLKGEHKLKSKSWATGYAHNAEHTKDEVVKFFKSQWCGTLCDATAAEKRLSYEQIAEIMNVHPNTVRNWFSGRSSMDGDCVLRCIQLILGGYQC